MVNDLDVNLSRLAQGAVRALAEERATDLDSRLDEIRLRVAKTDIRVLTPSR